MNAGKTRTGSPTHRFAPGAVVGLYHIKTQRLYRFDEQRKRRASTQALTVGRSAACDIHLHDACVSALHFEIERGGDGSYVVKDAGSKNGLWVNDVRVAETPLSPGMWIGVGSAEMIAVGDDGVLPIVARRNTSFLVNSVRVYGSMRRAAAFVGRSRSTIWRAVRRMAARSAS